MGVAETVFHGPVTVALTSDFESFVAIPTNQSFSESSAVGRQKEPRFATRHASEEERNRFASGNEIVCVGWLGSDADFEQLLITGALIG
jgi:hypothetical protein